MENANRATAMSPRKNKTSTPLNSMLYSSKQCTILPDNYPFCSDGYNGIEPMSAKQGFKEIDHTADAALRIWGETLPLLFQQAVLGLYALAGVRTQAGEVGSQLIHLQGKDAESLLVNFLSELLFILNEDKILCQIDRLEIHKNSLTGKLKQEKVLQIQKEIKAVTYHRLKITHNGSYYQTDLVLDV